MSMNDFVGWKVNGRADGPLMFWDALWSLFSNSGDFYRLLERTVPALSHQGLSADAALAEALQRIFHEVLPVRKRVVRDAIEQLHRRGVPKDLINPDDVGQDWGHSQLTSGGVLTLRVEMYMRGSVAPILAKAEAEAQVIVAFPPQDSASVGLTVNDRIFG